MTINEFENYIKEKDKKHIIFDFDGTICKLLIDWSDWKKELEEIVAEYDLGVSGTEAGLYEIQSICVEKGGQEARTRILEMNYRIEKEYCAGFELLPVALPVLEVAKKWAQLYVWTSNDQRTIMPILEELKIEKMFERVVTRNDVDFIKPHPQGFDLIYDAKNPKSQYLIIGDSSADEGAGKNSGIDFLNITEFELA